MGVDGIGKGARPAAAPDAQGTHGAGASPTGSVSRPFSADRAEGAEGAKAAENVASTEAARAVGPLARLRAGEIDVDRYLDLKVDEATAGLKGLSSAELEDIRTVLRDQIASDPGLVDLVKTATGQTPKVPEE